MAQKLLLLVLGTMALEAQAFGNFQTDVIWPAMLPHMPPVIQLLHQHAQKQSNAAARRLPAHDNMTPEEQQQLFACVGVCPMLTELAGSMGGGSPNMVLLCEAMACIQTNIDTCSIIQKMMDRGSAPAPAGAAPAPAGPNMAGMVDCICNQGCELAEDSMEDPKKMCALVECFRSKDACKEMLESLTEQENESTQVANCICDEAVKTKVFAMMDANKNIGAPSGTCSDAKGGEGSAKPIEDGVDLCELSKAKPDGDCAKVLHDAYTAMESFEGCAKFFEDMTKDFDDDTKACIETIKEAQKPADTDVSANANLGKSLAGLWVVVAALLLPRA